ncbi:MULTISPECIES: helix-turn-helix domain-containing protein [unclassified Mycobacterium]|uniref:helix-turn-helix domain-containing protein n=1 Tax=unclassified Mycobacterium TaxID=2642494 RepID=UPI0007FFB190|nr:MULTISPECIES: helix-turn-helix domain-containing protein [unclassified Mycobacterium]OBG69031.1 transcriptional regulator [Mycobacterium sp. E188]OBG82940.1 transcriptional regulator [Mycobacterium sp. E3305]OBH33499.1 transcriptional regulator [Mycobacterium sp. E183]
MRGVTSAPAERVLDVVEFLSRPEDGGHRFSDVARELGLSQATAHSILKTLCDRGWATRDPISKKFDLGPTIALIAERFEAARPLLAVAREAIHRLTEATGAPASVVERSGDELVITAFESPDGSNAPVASLERIPYAPPFGIACAAWDIPTQQESWIQRGAAGDTSLAERLRAVLAQTRDRGYDVDWMTPALAQAAHAIETLSTETVPHNLRSVVDQLRIEFISANLLSGDGARDALRVATISAPVLDDRGHVRLILGFHPLRAMTMSEIHAAAKPLLREVDRVGGHAVPSLDGARAKAGS